MAINPIELNADEKYFADAHYMSVSRWKKFHQCELAGLEDWGEPSDAQLVGAYVDAWVSGTLDEFIEKNPRIISSRGATKGQLKADFRQADEIIKHIQNDERIMQFLSGRKQEVMTGEIAGVPFKIKIDDIDDKAIKDLKIMRSITNRKGEYIDFVTMWGYEFQGSAYQEIVRQNIKHLPFFLIPVTKENPINSAIVHLPDEFLELQLEVIEETIPRYYDIWQGRIEPVGCGVCDVCISKRTETPIISFYDLQGGD